MTTIKPALWLPTATRRKIANKNVKSKRGDAVFNNTECWPRVCSAAPAIDLIVFQFRMWRQIRLSMQGHKLHFCATLLEGWT